MWYCGNVRGRIATDREFIEVTRTDVVVVGAGVAGLAGAQRLSRLGIDVVVIEARSRVGGRVCTLRTIDGDLAELGAQVIHGQHSVTWDWVHANRLQTVSIDLDVPLFVCIDSKSVAVSQFLKSGIVAPWRVEKALRNRDLPDVSLTSLIDGVGLTGVGRRFVEQWIEQTWCADSNLLSVRGMSRLSRSIEVRPIRYML